MADRYVTPKELREIWLAYADFRRPLVSPNTWSYDYPKIEKRILLLMKENPDMKDARDMRQWLLDRFALETARRTMQQWNAAFKWAVADDRFPYNPFLGLTKYMTTRRQQSETDYTAFTTDERAAILAAFEKEHPYYVDWVWFLFHSGCRPEEASALKWEHVAADCSQILIKEARRIDTGWTGPTKNYQTTRFPCNPHMQEFLKRLYIKKRSDYILPSVKGGPFDYKNFQSRRWRPTIQRLVAEGKVAFELSQYHCRHTVITQLIKSGLPEADVSYLCRVSIATIQRYYVSQSRTIVVPQL